MQLNYEQKRGMETQEKKLLLDGNQRTQHKKTG